LKDTNKACVLYEHRKFVYETRDIPSLKPNYVIIKIHSVGICGSDVHYWAHGKCGMFVTKGPLVLGHECSGTIVAVDPLVKHLKPGDRVAIEPGVPCRLCNFCRTGRYNLCPYVAFLATPPIDGSLTTYISHPGDFCFKLPDHVSFEEAALLEPFSVGVHACRRGNVSAGSHVLITGAGPVGLVSLLAAKAFGATQVIMTDVMQNRLDVAKQLGASGVFLLEKGTTEADLLQKLSQFQPITQTFECSGQDSAMRLAILATAPGGRIMSIGRSGASTNQVPLFEAMDKEIDICGSFRYHNSYATALEIAASKRVDLKPLVTHRFPFEESQKAFETAEVGKDGAIKVVIQVFKDSKL